MAPTRFMIISDTHNYTFPPLGTPSPFSPPFPHIDVLLHCGDLTWRGGVSSYNSALRMLGSIPAELKLVIAGNHDVDLDWKWCLLHHNEENEIEAKMHEDALGVMKGELAKEMGVVYLEEGTHTFTLKNGSTFTIYASPYTKEFNSWGFGYEESEGRFSLQSQIPPGLKSKGGQLIEAKKRNQKPVGESETNGGIRNQWGKWGKWIL